jgi:hypothetical protein
MLLDAKDISYYLLLQVGSLFRTVRIRQGIYLGGVYTILACVAVLEHGQNGMLFCIRQNFSVALVSRWMLDGSV